MNLSREQPGDILVFLPTERDIRETATVLGRRCAAVSDPPMEILPLYARLPAKEQNRIFAAHQQRRIVLATNVAESSLTVPGIRTVDRHGHGPHQSLLAPLEGAAAADRGRLAGLGRPAQGTLRTRRARHLHPAVQRRRLSQSRQVHHAGDPPHQSGRGDPADHGAETRRDRRVPVSRSAAPRGDSRRLSDALRAGSHRSPSPADASGTRIEPTARSIRGSGG